jgi:hypothetical protein
MATRTAGYRRRAAAVVVAAAVALGGGAARAADAEPVARWGFDAEETSRLVSHGGVHRDEPGPRPPEFPDADPGNLAVKLDGAGSHFAFADPGANSPLDFPNGDPITLEAWVNLADLKRDENAYVVGKGRTGTPGFARDNQNWALRIREVGGQARVSFLFATAPAAAGGAKAKGAAAADAAAKDAVAKGAHWHRWTTAAGFPAVGQWHHVAVAYRFGDPDSVRGWVDGRPTGGTWDMGGPTREPPVVDDDAVWIGSSQGGAAGSSFRGLLDDVAIYRAMLTDDAMRARYRRDPAAAGSPASPSPAPAGEKSRAAKATPAAPANGGPDVLPAVGPVPAGRALVTFHDAAAAPAGDRWPAAAAEAAAGSTASVPPPPETARWATEAFAVPRLPVRYDGWGIRQGWAGPVLVRVAADVALPPGPNRFVLRARGLGRLWVDGAVVARTKPQKGGADGYDPVPPVPAPPLPGLRPAGYGDQEAFGEAVVGPGGRCRVVLETLVGSRKARPEPGELSAAVRSADGSTYLLLTPAFEPGGTPAAASAPPVVASPVVPATPAAPPVPASPVPAASALPLTDAGWEAAAARAEVELTAVDDAARRAAAGSRDGFWANRHAIARRWATDHAGPAVPVVPATTVIPATKDGAAAHPVDAFLSAKIDRAVAAAAGAGGDAKAHAAVLPLLAENCFRCHGDKDKGDLKLNDRAAALKAGESGRPAVVPGDVAKSELVARITSDDPDERMPPTGPGLAPQQIAAVEAWVRAGAPWPAAPLPAADVTPPPAASDAAFLRRAFLDTVGVGPTDAEVAAFLADASPDKRAKLVDRLLADDRFADGWVGTFQDVLAENPNILKPTLNNTGPFRHFLYEALRDNKPIDRLATELILLRGSKYEGGSAGFGMAADNDAPLAARGQVVASAFLGVEMQCARCHDAPFHSSKQADLYALAAMLDRRPAVVPPSSTVPAAFFERKARESLIKVTLKPGVPVPPKWPFAAALGVADDPAAVDALTESPTDTRERLAALVTAPQNDRFAKVLVNRAWKRLMGAGFVEPAGDWEGHPPSHPELLDWMAKRFVAGGYDLRSVVRLVMTSAAYGREAAGHNLAAAPDRRFFAAPDRRRLTAEQVVDCLFAAAGKAALSEELTVDADARRPADTMISLGTPRRAWQFAGLSNERDRPSLSLPRAQAVADVLEAFGWTGTRQSPRADREADPNVLQPGVLANGTMSTWVTRATAGGWLAEAAVAAASPEALADAVYARFLARPPTSAERARVAAALAPGFAARLVAVPPPLPPPPERLSKVSWANHLVPEATTIQQEMERRARAGDPPDPRLEPDWREAYEDAVWAVVNSPEFVWVP